MNFFSFQFTLFILITIVLYFCVPKKFQWYVLLLSSCWIYVISAGKRAFAVAVFTALFTYLTAIGINNEEVHKKKKKLILYVGLLFLIGFLTVIKLVKYKEVSYSWLVIPLGVSYYTFSLVGYLVDVYSKKQQVETNFLKMLLFTIFFPKIVQGPISKYKNLMPQLVENHKINYQNFCCGMERILWGYFKKLVIVERALMLTNNIFDGDISDYSGGGAFLIIATVIGAISYYCDFSGYMDIVIGISKIMGIELDENFRQPFFSKSAAEFWRRWHITLGAWFKDYVYMSLVVNPVVIKIGKWFKNHIGKKASKAVITAIPLAVVWLLTGLWHGTGINYIIWGCYWGAIIIISNIFSTEIRGITDFLHINTMSNAWKMFQTIRTFSIFVVGLIFSTFVGLGQIRLYAWYIIKDFGIDRLNVLTIRTYGNSVSHMFYLCIAVIVLWIVDAIQYKNKKYCYVMELKWFVKIPILAVLIFTIFIIGVYGAGYSTSGFAYANF